VILVLQAATMLAAAIAVGRIARSAKLRR